MSSFFLHLGSSPGSISPSDVGRCFNQFGNYACDGVITQQTDDAFIGLRYLNTESSTSLKNQYISKEGKLWGVLDGCINNVAELEHQFHLPQHTTVIESLLALYKARGTEFLEQLQGQFALAIVETSARLVVLYRSKLGQMPLYYHANSERILAASEERAIVAHPSVSCEPDKAVLVSRFALTSSHQLGHTAFSDIKESLPGECLTWNQGKITQLRSPLRLGQSVIRYRSDQDYALHYRQLMEQMVARCLPTNGPVGVMLSSGLDSAPAAAIAAVQLKNRDQSLTAYSWSLPGCKSADESDQIRHVASFANIPLQLIPASHRWPLYDRDNLHITANSPLSNAFQGLKDSVLEVASADGCKVILNGWFGDRLFMFSQRHLVSEALRSGHAGLALGELLYWAQQKGWKGLWNRAFLRIGNPQRNSTPTKPWLSEFSLQHLINENWPPEAELHRHPDHFRNVSGPGNFQFGGVGKATFGRFGLEQRNLYQDEDLIDFMLSIPLSQFKRLGQTKLIARNAARGLIPESIRKQSRVGVLSEFYEYGLWNRERAWLKERLFDGQSAWDQYIDRSWLSTQFTQESPPETASLVAWQCLTYELWREKVKALNADNK